MFENGGKMKQKIMDWYNGRPPSNEERLAEMIRLKSGFPAKQLQKYHWTAKVARWAVKEYKWIVWVILTSIAAFAGAYAAFK